MMTSELERKSTGWNLGPRGSVLGERGERVDEEKGIKVRGVKIHHRKKMCWLL
jgi:hypothetical protein